MVEIPNHHVMELAITTDEYGEWTCPQCEYRWRQYYGGGKEVLTPSLSDFGHSGSASGLRVGSVNVRSNDGLDIWRDAIDEYEE